MCQIQGFTLHLVALTQYLSGFAFGHYATERMTNPYSGGPVCYMQISSQQATIARLPLF